MALLAALASVLRGKRQVVPPPPRSPSSTETVSHRES
jgi:hypothetical protein